MADHTFYIFWSYAALAVAIGLELFWLRGLRRRVLARVREKALEETP
jgi:Heme exporter protein D (CcmD)